MAEVTAHYCGEVEEHIPGVAWDAAHLQDQGLEAQNWRCISPGDVFLGSVAISWAGVALPEGTSEEPKSAVQFSAVQFSVT